MPDLCSVLLPEDVGTFNQEGLSTIVCEQEREAV